MDRGALFCSLINTETRWKIENFLSQFDKQVERITKKAFLSFFD